MLQKPKRRPEAALYQGGREIADTTQAGIPGLQIPASPPQAAAGDDHEVETREDTRTGLLPHRSRWYSACRWPAGRRRARPVPEASSDFGLPRNAAPIRPQPAAPSRAVLAAYTLTFTPALWRLDALSRASLTLNSHSLVVKLLSKNITI